MIRKSIAIVSLRRIPLLVAFFCAIMSVLLAAGCSRSDSVTVQVDLQKSIDISNQARSPGTSTRAAVTAFTLAAGMDDVLRKTIETDEFRQLAISKRFAPQDDARHTNLLKALTQMCSTSVRAAPAAARVSVAGADTAESTAIANLIGRTLGEAAMINAAADLATRREIEHQTLARVQTQTKDLDAMIHRMNPVARDEPSDTVEAATPHEQARILARCEVAKRELSRLRSDESITEARSLEFEYLVATVVACPAWIVPANSNIETGWMPIERIEQSAALLAVVDPAGGREWLAGALSPSEKTVSAATGDVDVSTTTWRIAFDQQASVSTVSLPSSADGAATSDLARRVRATPLGDGTVVSLGLTGSVSATDQRAIMNALVRCILAKKRWDINIESVNKSDPLGRRINMLDTELRERERAFVDLAERSAATSESIASLYNRSPEGQEIERVQNALATLRKQRDMIDLESRSLFDDVFLIRNVERAE